MAILKQVYTCWLRLAFPTPSAEILQIHELGIDRNLEAVRLCKTAKSYLPFCPDQRKENSVHENFRHYLRPSAVPEFQSFALLCQNFSPNGDRTGTAFLSSAGEFLTFLGTDTKTLRLSEFLALLH